MIFKLSSNELQVTRLTCGGFIFAVRLNHTISDSLGLVQFLNTVAEMASGSCVPSKQPVWQRHILNARDPPRITCIHHEYEMMNNNKCTTIIENNDMVHWSFFFGPKEMRSIRKHLPQHLQTCTTFEILTACLWKCRTIALEFDPNDVVRLSCSINLRGKQGMQYLQVPNGYYGNAFAFPTVLSKAELLCKNPLGYALDLVKKTKAEMSEEYIKSVADLMVIKGRPPYITAGNFFVADTTQVGFSGIDFGWGKPIYARFKNKKGENGVVVPIRLPLPAMERFQLELLKITQEPVDQSYGIMSTKITSTL